MTEGLAPRPIEEWRGVLREQAARGLRARQRVASEQELCGGCGRLLSVFGGHVSGETQGIVGLTAAKDGYLCRGCFDLAYGDAT